jgi:hypothetical protein
MGSSWDENEKRLRSGRCSSVCPNGKGRRFSPARSCRSPRRHDGLQGRWVSECPSSVSSLNTKAIQSPSPSAGAERHGEHTTSRRRRTHPWTPANQEWPRPCLAAMGCWGSSSLRSLAGAAAGVSIGVLLRFNLRVAKDSTPLPPATPHFRRGAWLAFQRAIDPLAWPRPLPRIPRSSPARSRVTRRRRRPE